MNRVFHVTFEKAEYISGINTVPVLMCFSLYRWAASFNRNCVIKDIRKKIPLVTATLSLVFSYFFVSLIQNTAKHSSNLAVSESENLKCF